MSSLMPFNLNPTMITKNRGKRTMEIKMMMTLVFLCFLPFSTSQQSSQDFTKYYLQYEALGIDHSSLKICFSFGGTVEPVSGDNIEKGYKCEAKTSTWVADNKQAMSFCTSRFPYHIIKAEKIDSRVACTFQINLKCETGWYQMRNKCYKFFSIKKTFKEAEDYCQQHNTELKTKLAEYYSGHLERFMKDLTFPTAWITAPDVESDYESQNLKAIMVVTGAYKYDTRPGTVLMMDPSSEHGTLCEYTPPMTMAEMYLIAEIYSEIYPIHVTTNGASFATSSYLTIDQVSLKTNSNGKKAESFTTKNIKERCQAIGNIISVDSHPMASIQEEFDDVKQFLTDHRFHLTSAFKNAGCQKTSYQDWDFSTDTLLKVYDSVHQTREEYCNAFSFSFHPINRLPSMAATRAPALCSLHSFSYEYGDCGSGWVTAWRSDTTKFCHYIYLEKEVTYVEAKKACLDMNAALTGFENRKEFQYVVDQFKDGSPGYRDHFWLGGVIPCGEDCTDSSYIASWDLGVSRNTHYLNTESHLGYPWQTNSGEDTISFRSDTASFHTHNSKTWTHMYYICGKFPPLAAKKQNIKKVNVKSVKTG